MSPSPPALCRSIPAYRSSGAIAEDGRTARDPTLPGSLLRAMISHSLVRIRGSDVQAIDLPFYLVPAVLPFRADDLMIELPAWEELDAAAKTAIGAAVIGWIAAAVTAALSFWSNRALENKKAGLQRNLEERKTELQTSLEEKKTELQKSLEDKKAGLQIELESKKESFQRELEEFKGQVAAEVAVRNARTAYEFDARKRLYTEIEPLLFQMYEAAENSFHAVASLVRSEKLGKLPQWLENEGYYLRSIVYRIFLPFVLLRLIQRSTTLVDLKLDSSIHLRYLLAKQAYLSWTDDFTIAALEPQLPYDPNVDGWETLRTSVDGERRHWRQGLVIGQLDRLVEGLIATGGTSQHPMSYGEFEKAVKSRLTEMCTPQGGVLVEVFNNVADVFLGASMVRRPVLARMLLVHACLMHVLMVIYSTSERSSDLAGIAKDFIEQQSKAGSQLSWWRDGRANILLEVQCYVLKRIAQAAASGDYAKF